jgi:hypothetical protein
MPLSAVQQKNGSRAAVRQRVLPRNRIPEERTEIKEKLAQRSPALLEGQFDGLVHLRKRRFNGASVAHSETCGFEVAEFSCAFGCALPIPGEQCRKWEEKLEDACCDDPRLCRKGVSSD